MKRKTALWLGGSAVLFFLNALFSSLAATNAGNAPLVYSHDFLQRFFSIFLFTAVMLPLFAMSFPAGAGRLCGLAALFALPSLFYDLPNEYVSVFIQGYGMEAALILGAVFGLGCYLVRTLAYFVLLLIARRLSVRRAPGAGAGAFDTSDPTTAALLLTGGAMTLLLLVREIYDIVSFTVTNFETLSGTEILYMALLFLWIPVSYLLSHLCCRWLYDRAFAPATDQR